ncbi:MAG: hypothetical protein ACPGU9_06580 [Flavobacteriaceae bacterium]
MKVKIITLTLLTLTFLGHSQSSSDISFSSALNTNVATYNLAIAKTNYKYNPKANELIFNDFVNRNIINTHFGNFKAKNLNGALIQLNNYFKKPLVLTTYASWFIIEKESVAELNELAKKHRKSVNFAVVFWENEHQARAKSKFFNRHVKVLYINERENLFSNEINVLKYPLGQSLIYYINNNNQIIDLRKNHYFVPEVKHTYNKAFVETSNQFTKGLSLLLLQNEEKDNHLASE